jgi:hypothetical protein
VHKEQSQQVMLDIRMKTGIPRCTVVTLMKSDMHVVGNGDQKHTTFI